MAGHDDPLVVTYKIPRIEVYQVTDDELCRIEEGYGRASQNLTSAISSLSFGVAFLIALLTGSPQGWLQVTLITFASLCAVIFLYTGARWLDERRDIPDVISKIRSRKTEPQTNPK